MRKIFIVSMLLFASLAGANPPAPEQESLANDTAGVILITLDDEPQIFIFVSKTGKVLATSAEICAKQKGCGELAQRLSEEGKANVIPVRTAKHGGTDT